MGGGSNPPPAGAVVSSNGEVTEVETGPGGCELYE